MEKKEAYHKDKYELGTAINYTTLSTIIEQVAKEFDSEFVKNFYITFSIEKDGREILCVDKFEKDRPSKIIEFRIANGTMPSLDDGVRFRFRYLLSMHGKSESSGIGERDTT